MRDLKSRISKLEKSNERNRNEIRALLDRENLNIFERVRILHDPGIITGEMIAGWIMEGSENDRN